MLAATLVYTGCPILDERNSERIGAKAARLCELTSLGYCVPRFYVITTAAWEAAVPAELSGALAGPDLILRRAAAAAFQSWLADCELPVSLVQAIARAHQQLAGPVAVRSSAAAEDGTTWSYAGIYETVLGVEGVDGVIHAIRRVWGSAVSQRAVAYSQQACPLRREVKLAVIVQEMVDAASSGVMFTRSPTGVPNQAMINALPGLGCGLVEMNLPSDTYLVDKSSGHVDRQLAGKSEQVILDSRRGATQCVATEPTRRDISTLSDEQVHLLVSTGMELERHFGRAQDIEFCFDKQGELHLLQARPATALGRTDFPTRLEASGDGLEQRPSHKLDQRVGNHLVWDNSNIVESYHGVTSPMTFSFVRRAYAIVYQCFLELMGVSPATIRANRRTAENMLGLFQGRIYYNLKSWYRLLRLFPGYQYNSRFMESMMGVGVSLSLDSEADVPRSRLKRWCIDLPALVRLLVRSAWNFHRIDAIVERFQLHFRQHYERWSRIDFQRLAPHDILALYREMEDALLWNWKAPILADFYAMIFHGLLRKLCTNWCRDDSGSLANELMCGEGDMESTQPARALLRLTDIAARDMNLRDLILHADLGVLLIQLRSEPAFAEFQAALEAYLAEFGVRCADELKLEEPSLSERPWMLLKMVRDYLVVDRNDLPNADALAQRDQSLRREAEQRADRLLTGGRWRFLRSWVFQRVLHAARRGVRHRENMRLARARIYGLFRQMLKATGGNLAAQGLLDTGDDVFYLTIEELWDYVQGTAVSTDLKGLVRLRRTEMDCYRRARSDCEPGARFETWGLPYHGNEFRERRPAPPAGDLPGLLRGTGCCPGVATGLVSVVNNPEEAGSLAGRILVAERTDPGWVPLYPAVAGILVERGSLLSHSAVVAREMGIPTIVGIRGLMRAVRTGQLVRMDGRQGTVELLADQQLSADLVEPEGRIEERPVAG